MDLLETQPWRANEDWRRVLSAYAADQSVQRTLDAQHEGWVRRVSAVEGVAGEQLTVIHGGLIAYGLLETQLAQRSEGLMYKVSGAGRDVLADTPFGEHEG